MVVQNGPNVHIFNFHLHALSLTLLFEIKKTKQKKTFNNSVPPSMVVRGLVSPPSASRLHGLPIHAPLTDLQHPSRTDKHPTISWVDQSRYWLSFFQRKRNDSAATIDRMDATKNCIAVMCSHLVLHIDFRTHQKSILCIWLTLVIVTRYSLQNYIYIYIW